MRSVLMAALVLMTGPALAAPALEAWNCRLSAGPQHWAVDGDFLVTDMAGLPVSMTRLPIVKNTDDAVMAVSDEYAGRRFEIVLIDKLRPGIRIVTLGAEGGAPAADTGVCVSGFARASAAAGGAMAGRATPSSASTVRPQIRKLLQQAESLTAQGFYDAALRKVRETANVSRQTPGETALIAQTRAYVMQKSGGKAR